MTLKEALAEQQRKLIRAGFIDWLDVKALARLLDFTDTAIKTLRHFESCPWNDGCDSATKTLAKLDEEI